MYDELEQLEFKQEKIIGIQKHAGKVRKGGMYTYTFEKQCKYASQLPFQFQKFLHEKEKQNLQKHKKKGLSIT